MSSLDRLLRPQSIAIVGASGQEGSLFALPLDYLRRHSFPGRVHPVNPRYDELGGWPCHPSLSAIGETVDLVLVMVGSERTLGVLDEAAAIGAGGAVVFASGFAESGDDGAQAALLDRARTSGLRLLGPNCQGFFLRSSSVVATFTAAADEMLPSSGLAYVGQSGAVGGSLLSLAGGLGIGLEAWISTGNQVDLDAVEAAGALLDEPAVRVLLLYFEQLPNGDRLRDLAERARATDRHIVVLRSGRTSAGRRAVASHTGALVGGDAAFELLCRELGVVRVDDVDELLLVGSALLHQAPVAGRRIAVITTSGGAGGLAADQCDDHGLTLAELAPVTTARLDELVPAYGSTANPVDVTAQVVRPGSTAFAEVLEAIVDDDDVDALLVLLTLVTGDIAEAFATAIADVSARAGRPVVVAWLASERHIGKALHMLRDARVPVVHSIDLAGALLERLTGAAPARRRGPTGGEAAAADIVLPELEFDAGPFLAALGLTPPASALVRTADAAARAASRLRGPLVLKLQVRGLAHKTEVGGVRLGVDPDDAATAFAALWALGEPFGERLQGVLLQEMAGEGFDLLVSVMASADGYPPVLTVGHGGTTTEVQDDVASALAPARPAEVEAMLHSLRCWPLLVGHRGAPALDVEAAAAAIARISEVAAATPGLGELEINPLRVYPVGAGVVPLDLTVGAAPS